MCKSDVECFPSKIDFGLPATVSSIQIFFRQTLPGTRNRYIEARVGNVTASGGNSTANPLAGNIGTDAGNHLNWTVST